MKLGPEASPSASAGSRTAARPCPGCGHDLKSTASRRVDWLRDPVRTCPACGLGVTERRRVDRSFSELPRTPISIVRLILVPLVLITIGCLVTVVVIEITATSPYITPTHVTTAVCICATVGILAVVSMSPHMGPIPCGLTWVAAIAVCGCLVVQFQLLILGLRINSLTSHRLGLIGIHLATVAVGGLLLSYPFVFTRDHILRLWTGSRSSGGPRS